MSKKKGKALPRKKAAAYTSYTFQKGVAQIGKNLHFATFWRSVGRV